MDLLQWRTAKEFNQQQAADHLGLTQATISRIESGALFPSPTVLAAINERSDGQITADDVHATWKDKREKRVGAA